MNNDFDSMIKEAPVLTLEPFGAQAKEAPSLMQEAKATKKEEEKIPEAQLTPEEQKIVNDFAAQIDITNTQMVLQYGAGCQKKIADFSESALNNVRTKDMEIGRAHV